MHNKLAELLEASVVCIMSSFEWLHKTGFTVLHHFAIRLIFSDICFQEEQTPLDLAPPNLRKTLKTFSEQNRMIIDR